MGVISWLFGGGVRQIASGVKDVAEVFRVNAEADAAREHQEFAGALSQFGQEFRTTPPGFFSGFVDALNRLPRPGMALGCIGLFAYAMADPIGFSVRMQGLQLVPEPLWWLLGAIVSFYFGARELHYLREGRRVEVRPEDVARTLASVRDITALAPAPVAPRAPAGPEADPGDAPAAAAAPPSTQNPALAEYAARAT